MTSPSGEALAPHIDIAVHDGEVVITQQRPALVSSLAGMPVAPALALIPTLLPICGQAQSLAAQRAVAAARGQAEVAAQPWREQAFAAAWRLAIDWPELLGEAHRMDILGRVHRAPDERARAAALRLAIPGLDAVQNLDQLLHWVRTNDCVAARVARLALDVDHPEFAVHCLNGDALAALAGESLAVEDFDAQDPGDRPLEVGPLAMARDPLVAELQAELAAGVPARVLAQILDTRVICRGLDSTAGAGEPETHTWSAADGVGMGRAITSRGPVFHRVCLDGGADAAVVDWRVLAPTDWHFAAGGPVALALPQMASNEAMKLLVTSYDPCAPWSLHAGEGGSLA